MLLLARTDPGLANRWGGGSASPPSNAAALRGFAEKGCRNFLEAAASRIPGLDGIFPQLPSPSRGDPLPERSSQTLTVKDLSFPQAGMRGKRQQHGHRLGKGTACTSELIWDGWMSPREEEVVRSCGDNRVNNHLQREHGEPGTQSQRAAKAIHQQELSLRRTPMAQRWQIGRASCRERV